MKPKKIESAPARCGGGVPAVASTASAVGTGQELAHASRYRGIIRGHSPACDGEDAAATLALRQHAACIFILEDPL